MNVFHHDQEILLASVHMILSNSTAAKNQQIRTVVVPNQSHKIAAAISFTEQHEQITGQTALEGLAC